MEYSPQKMKWALMRQDRRYKMGEVIPPRSEAGVGMYLPVEADSASLLSLHPVMF